jgi:hypothetical protein
MRRLPILAAFALILAPLTLLVRAPAEPKNTEYSGKVVPLADSLDKLGAKLDKDAAPFWLALVTDDGKVHPLIKDPGSRMFFKDKHLLNRAMKITGRLVGDAKLLQVLSVRSVVNGKLHEPYYWCDICKIKRFEPNDCDCCQAPLEFREDPVK